MTYFETVLKESLKYLRRENYVGWDKHDGMSSRVLKAFPFDHKWTNLAIKEVIKRAPMNLRPLFLVEKRPNPKGLSLFTMVKLNVMYWCHAWMGYAISTHLVLSVFKRTSQGQD